MPRYFIQLSFKGTCYHGWQAQPNAHTVQAEVEKAFKTITGEDITTTGAGRNDAGVHAHSYTAHFDTENLLNPAEIAFKMNAVLPPDIAVNCIFEVKPDVHARFTAVSRTYKYRITRVKDPFNTEFSLYFPQVLDTTIMNQAAILLKEYTDFTSFSKLHTDVKTNNCRIYEAFWTQMENELIFYIRADRFLRNMVRSIVGTMLDIGRGKTDLKGLDDIISGKNRSLAGASVPAHGLILWEIEYPKDITLQMGNSGDNR